MFDQDMADVAALKKKGFTLLELLIVIGIIAVLSVVLILVLNPAETLKKSRDTQRLSDLSTLKTALGLYVTSVASPDLGTNCLGTSVTTAEINYSLPLAADPSCAVDTNEGGDVTSGSTFDSTDMCRYATSANYTKVDANGWIPVNFTSISGGSPIASLPLDPTNTMASTTAPAVTDLVYRYACQETAAGTAPANVFEINARLESAAYGPGGTDDKALTDGGTVDVFFEVGSSLRLMGTTSTAY